MHSLLSMNVIFHRGYNFTFYSTGKTIEAEESVKIDGNVLVRELKTNLKDVDS